MVLRKEKAKAALLAARPLCADRSRRIESLEGRVLGPEAIHRRVGMDDKELGNNKLGCLKEKLGKENRMHDKEGGRANT